MKKTILLPLFLGLMLAGCSRTESPKSTASNDQSYSKPTPANTPADQKLPEPAQVAAAPNPTPPAATDPNAVANKPAMDPSTSVVASGTTPSSPATIPPPVTTPSSAELASSTPPAPADATKTETDATKMEAKPDLTARIAEWNLKPEDIKSEFETSGRVTRSRTAGAGEPTGPMDDVLVSQIKSKFGDNADTSGLQLEVTAEKGVVTLNGSAHSLDQIGKAIAVALDTPGVTQTISLVKLDATP